MHVWGWIPSLDPHSTATPVPERTTMSDSTETAVIKPNGSRLMVVLPDIQVEVSLIDNMMMFDDIDGDSTLYSEHVYNIVKNRYHSDVTHETGSGLQTVRGETFSDALKGVLIQFVQWIDEDKVERNYDIIPSASDVIRRIGMLDYGLAFIERYQSHLPTEMMVSCKEILVSNKMYLEKRHSELNTEHMRQLSDNSHRLDKSMSRINWTVLAITYMSTAFGMHSVIQSSGLASETLLGLTTMSVAVVPTAIILLAGWLRS